MGHGHVNPNKDGSLARCGGPSICKECATEVKLTDSPKNPVREWWISSTPVGGSTRGGGWTQYLCFSDEMASPEAKICVVEKAAYEKLQTELAWIEAKNKRIAELEAENNRLKDYRPMNHFALEKERDELRAEVERLKNITHDLSPEDYLTPYEAELLQNEKKLKIEVERLATILKEDNFGQRVSELLTEREQLEVIAESYRAKLLNCANALDVCQQQLRHSQLTESYSYEFAGKTEEEARKALEEK